MSAQARRGVCVYSRGARGAHSRREMKGRGWARSAPRGIVRFRFVSCLSVTVSGGVRDNEVFYTTLCTLYTRQLTRTAHAQSHGGARSDSRRSHRMDRITDAGYKISTPSTSTSHTEQHEPAHVSHRSEAPDLRSGEAHTERGARHEAKVAQRRLRLGERARREGGAKLVLGTRWHHGLPQQRRVH